ncbi:MAG: PfkB family carbohydrate kinase [Solimonas sp.]
MTRIVMVGEGMLELAADSSTGSWKLGYGGDTLNTAVHLARFCRQVAAATALGADPFSEGLRATWAAEGSAEASNETRATPSA